MTIGELVERLRALDLLTVKQSDDEGNLYVTARTAVRDFDVVMRIDDDETGGLCSGVSTIDLDPDCDDRLFLAFDGSTEIVEET